MKCEGCNQELEEAIFLPKDWDNAYTHLGLVDVCLACRQISRVCTDPTCIQKGKPYPATRVWFSPRESGKFGLHSLCKACSSKRAAGYQKRQREIARKGRLKYKWAPKVRACAESTPKVAENTESAPKVP